MTDHSSRPPGQLDHPAPTALDSLFGKTEDNAGRIHTVSIAQDQLASVVNANTTGLATHASRITFLLARLAAIDEHLSSQTARLGSLTARIQRLEESLAAARAPTDRPPLRRPPSEPLGATHDPNPRERYYRALWLLERAQPMIDELVNITEGDPELRQINQTAANWLDDHNHEALEAVGPR